MYACNVRRDERRPGTACTCYILPPHIIDKLASHPDPRVRDAALGTRLATHALRATRTILGQGFRGSLKTGGLRRTVYDAGNESDLPGRLVRSEGSAAVSDTAVNEAYDGAGKTYTFYKEVFKRNSIDDQGMRLDSTVHFREDPLEAFDNAFWNGEQMIYGDGDGVIFGRFTQCLDVIGHELTHGVTQYEAGLAYSNQAGALNESFSDVMGTLVLQYSKKQTLKNASWLIGEQLFIAPKQALRSLKAPGTAYDLPEIGQDPQPGHMDDYVHLPNSPRGDYGGVHINSGIPNRAFYEACVNLGKTHSWDQAGPIWYDALCNRLKTKSTFRAAKAATVASAQELYGKVEADAVRQAWETVGVVAAS
jgi:Zn-dependent metalloprotease